MSEEEIRSKRQQRMQSASGESLIDLDETYGCANDKAPLSGGRQLAAVRVFAVQERGQAKRIHCSR